MSAEEADEPETRASSASPLAAISRNIMRDVLPDGAVHFGDGEVCRRPSTTSLSGQNTGLHVSAGYSLQAGRPSSREAVSAAEDKSRGLDEYGLPHLDLKWRRVQHTCLDGGYFSEFELKPLRIAYNRFLVPGSKEVHKDDLEELVQYLGYILLSPADVHELANEITPYSDLDFEDFVRFVEKYAVKECASFRDVFEKYDVDKSGAISTRELRNLMSDLGFVPTKQLIKDADSQIEHNENGELTFRELVHFFTVYRHTQGFNIVELQDLKSIFDSFVEGANGGMPVLSVARALIQAFGLQFEDAALSITKAVPQTRNNPEDASDPISPKGTRVSADVVEFYEFLGFARRLKEAEQKEYRKEFRKHDKDNSGHIDVEELQEALKNLGHEPTRGVIVEVLKEVDFEVDGKLDMEEFYNFMTVFRDREGFQKAELEEMRQVFSKFDVDGSNTISVHELGDMLRYMGHSFSKDDLHRLISQVDVDRSGDLDFREFIRLMRLHRSSQLQRLRNIFEHHQDLKTGRLANAMLLGALSSTMGPAPPLVLIQALPLLLHRATKVKKPMQQLALPKGHNSPSSTRASRVLHEIATGIPDLTDKRAQFLKRLQQVNNANEVPLTNVQDVARGTVLQVVSDVNTVKQACMKAGLADKDNVARAAAVGSIVHVTGKDQAAGTVKCNSSLHGEMWFAIGALCNTQVSEDIADTFAESLPALQGCGASGIDFDAYVELADLFRTIRNAWDRMKAGFSDLEIKRFQGVFALYDADGSGDIDEKELTKLLRHVGVEVKTKQDQEQVKAQLAEARKLAVNAGVEVKNDPGSHSFWEFVQLMRIERTNKERAFEEQVEKASEHLNFSSKEVAQFREIFLSWARWQRTEAPPEAQPKLAAVGKTKSEMQVQDLLGSGPQEAISMYTLIKALQSLGCTIRTKDEPTLQAQIASVTTDGRGQLGFVGFLQMMRWLLDSDFGEVHKASAKLNNNATKGW